MQSSIGNYGTVSFLPNKQFDRRTQLAANLTWLTRHAQLQGRRRVQPGLRRSDLRLQPVRPLHRQQHRYTDDPRHLQRRRHDRQPVRFDRRGLPAADRQPSAGVPDAGDRLLRPGQLEGPAEPHDQLRRALGRRGQPDAGGQQRLHAQRPERRDLPEPQHDGRPDADSGPVESVGPARRLRVGRGQRRPHRRPRLHRHLLRALARAALCRADEQLPRAGRRPVAPVAVCGAGEQPELGEQHRLQAAQADWHRPQHLRAGEPARSSRPSSSRRWLPRSASTRTRSTRPSR